jgi:hypothetical protein
LTLVTFIIRPVNGRHKILIINHGAGTAHPSETSCQLYRASIGPITSQIQTSSCHIFIFQSII